MIDWLERGAAFVVAISVLIAVHEFGHFWVARRLGFKVLKFSIGFGRALVSRTGRDGVEYALSVIPLGGYVKLVDEREAEVADADRPRAFNRRPVWQRILVLLAGAGANFVFAIVALWVLYLVGVPGLKPVVGDVRAASIAASGGLKRGDELLAVGDHEVSTRGDAVLEMLSQIVDGGRLELKLRRAGGTAYATLEVPPEQRRALTEPGAWNDGLGFDWAPPHLPAVVARVVPDGAAAAAGLAAGDEIVGLDGRPVADFLDFRSEISARPGAHVVLDVRRGAARLSLPLTVAGKRDPAGRLVGQIGVEAKGPAVYPPELRVLQRYGPLGAVRPALAEAWSNAAVTVKFLWRMVTGDVSLRNVSGPISIATYAGASALEGPRTFLSFLVIISISLGVLNLLPIPVLDGGQIVYQLAEAIKGRPLSPRALAIGQQIGLVLLILLMTLALYNDLARHAV